MNLYKIVFSGTVDTYCFEEILKLHFYKSKLKINTTILFDFEYVNYCGLLELSQVSLWILSLKEKGKIIKFNLPVSNTCYNFFYNYEFINFLAEKGILDKNTKTKNEYTPESGAMFPMKFQDNKEFLSLLSDLNSSERSSLIFSSIKDNELVKNGVIHSVLLREIGDNVFTHSRTNRANIIVTKHPDARRKRKIEFENTFFEKVGKLPLVEVVISDFGVGYFSKLIDAYREDSILPEESKKEEPNHCDIIKYAFLKHSTSRTDDERKKELQNKLKSNSLKYPLPTGLYKVLNMVRQYSGSIFIRSGKGIVFYDYFSDSGQEKVFTTKYDKKLKDISYFPGVQIRIYFPIMEEVKRYRDFYPSHLKSNSGVQNKIIGSINLNTYIKNIFDVNNSDDIENLQKLLDTLEKIKLKHCKNKVAVLVDAYNFRFIQNKNIRHLILSTILSSQTLNFSYILLNLSNKTIHDINHDYCDDDFLKYFLPLLAYDKKFAPYLIGYEKLSFLKIKDSLSDDKEKNEIQDLLNHSAHIINFNHGFEINYEKHDIIETHTRNLRDEFAKKFTDKRYNIYYPEEKVLIQNSYYCHGFFELSNIDDSEELKSEICHWITLKLQISRPDHIVTIGNNVTDYLKVIYKDFEEQNIKLHANLHGIDTDNIYVSIFNLQQNINKEESILIICDVIGSGETLLNVVNNLKGNKLSKILCLVDAIPITEKFRKHIDIEVNSLVEIKIEYYNSMPKHWDYTDIKYFDKNLHRLVENSSPPKGPILHDLSKISVSDSDGSYEIAINPFLEELSSVEDSYFKDHYVSRQNHICYFYNISQIIKYYTKNFSSCIATYLNESERKIRRKIQSPEGTYHPVLVYPTFNPGIQQLAEAIAKEIPKLELIKLNEADLISGLQSKYDFINSLVIIIDDAIVSGSTIEKMIDIVHERRAKYIFTFAVFKRGNSYQGRKFENLKLYGNSSVHSRYLIDAEIPIYNSETCPICKKVDELTNVYDSLKKNDNFKNLTDFISTLLINYHKKPINSVKLHDDFYIKKVSENKPLHSNPDILKYDKVHFSTLNLRWKLEIAINDVAMRKNIVEIFKRRVKYRETSLKLLRILSEEKFYFILNEKISTKLIYPQFRNIIINVCNDLLYDGKYLNCYDIFCIADLLVTLDESYFIENLHKILIHTQNDEKSFYSVVTAMFFISTFHETPFLISEKLEIVEMYIQSEKLKPLVFNLLHWVKRRNEFNFEQNNLTIQSYKASSVQIHNIRHFLDSIKHYLTPQSYDLILLKENISSLAKELQELFKNLNTFSRNINSKKHRDIITSNIKRINSILLSVNKDIETDQVPSNQSDSLLSSFKEITEIVCVNNKTDNIPNVLDSFKIDIRKTCYEILKQEESKLKEKGFHSDYFLPENEILVFGIESDIVLIFKNLIENIHTHSNGNLCMIEGLISADKNHLKLYFIDNGGSKVNKTPNEGLMSVSKCVNYSRGTFNIYSLSNCTDIDQLFAHYPRPSHGTIAEVSLPLVNNIADN